MSKSPFAILPPKQSGEGPKVYHGPESEQDREEFKRLLHEMKAAPRLEPGKRRQVAADRKGARAKKERNQKIYELQALLVILRARLQTTGDSDAALLAQIYAAELQLYWLMYGK